MDNIKKIKEKAIIVAISLDDDARSLEASVDELENLLHTAGGETACIVVQNREKPDPATCLGKGKLEEIAEIARADEEINLIVFDNELTPSQIRNIEDKTEVRVIDRTMLILDIFASHAVTNEGKMQVEIAFLRYSAPRLTGKGIALSRQGGTGGSGGGGRIATRGPGESKLETDRRHIKRRIATLEQAISEMDKNRRTARKQREKSGIASAAIIGYTNAGKSTLLNYLTGAGILAEDKLFATLDPTTRKLTLPQGTQLLLTDTVGFIDRLPTHLVRAFRSTLNELKYADIIIKLIDASESSDERARKNAVTSALVEDFESSDKPIIEVYNKCDKMVDSDLVSKEAICISASTGKGVEALLERIEKIAGDGKKILKLYVPHTKQAAVSEIYKYAKVLSVEQGDEGATFTAECDSSASGRLSAYLL